MKTLNDPDPLAMVMRAARIYLILWDADNRYLPQA
jgi:hypothetical protein